MHLSHCRRISQMTYKPKSVGKMADFENFFLCISLNSSQMCASFFSGAKSIVMQISFVMLIFHCFRTKFREGQKSLGGCKLLQGGAPCPLWKKRDCLYLVKIRFSTVIRFQIDDYAKDGRPEAVGPSCSFYHDPLRT